jgi:DNA-binding response OmpR family regulator
MVKMDHKKKVIIVDDDKDLLRLLSSSFKSKGFEVELLENGKEALTYLMDEKNIASACLLVLDRLLPDIEGLEIFRKLDAKFPSHFPVLILSALSAEKDVLEGLKVGAIDYISKPFSLPIFMEKALSLIERAS